MMKKTMSTLGVCGVLLAACTSGSSGGGGDTALTPIDTGALDTGALDSGALDTGTMAGTAETSLAADPGGATGTVDTAVDTALATDPGGPPKTPEGIKVMSTSGSYVAYFTGAEAGITAGKILTLGLTVTVADGALAPGLDFTKATFIHTQMGHGSGKIPETVETAAGSYTVKNVAASMAGTWRLTLTFAGTGASDTFAYDVEVTK